MSGSYIRTRTSSRAEWKDEGKIETQQTEVTDSPRGRGEGSQVCSDDADEEVKGGEGFDLLLLRNPIYTMIKNVLSKVTFLLIRTFYN